MLEDCKNILVFDTTTTACTVALKTSRGLFSQHKEEINIHSQALLTMIDQLLVEASLNLRDIDYLAVGVGPGSFTGLRIGIGVAQGLAYSNQIKLIPISTLEMIALNLLNGNENINPKEKIVVAQDARMSEVYWCTYTVEENDRLTIASEVSVSSPKDICIPQGEVHLCGNAWSVYDGPFSELDASLITEKTIDSNYFFPCAKQTLIYIEKHLQSFKVVDWKGIQPVYVRNNVAKKAKIKP